MTKINTPYNKTYQKQNNKLVPYSFKKGFISALHINNNSADVTFIGNSQTVVKNIPFATNVNISKISIGDKCKVDIFNTTNQSDMVIAYTYGNNNTSSFFSTGSAVISQAIQSAIPHGLGVVPNFVSTTPTVAPADGFNTIAVWESQKPDATNIYLTGYYGPVTVNWYAGKL